MESLFNRLIESDQKNKDALLKYKGKVLVVDFINTKACYAISITDHGISLDCGTPSSADVTVKATPLAFINYMGAVKRSEALVSGVMEITGDIALAQAILSITRDLEFDWEEYLSYLTGDILAHKTQSLVSNSINMLNYANNALRDDLSEYLLYESSHLISDSEMQEFNSNIENLRDDVERLRARVERIQRTTEGKE
jgi:ubiquinone biosynthesis protein UbiJ